MVAARTRAIPPADKITAPRCGLMAVDMDGSSGIFVTIPQSGMSQIGPIQPNGNDTTVAAWLTDLDQRAAVNRQSHAGDEIGLVGRQE